MSQKKVDAYKARKGQHSKADKKEKMLFGLEMFAWAFICVVIVAWIGYSAYAKVTGAKENVVQNTVMDTTALDNYISNMTTDTTDDADSTDADTTDADAEDTTASEARTQLQMILPQIQKKPLMIKNQQTILHPQMTQRQKVQILLLQTAQTLNKSKFL